MRAPVVDRRGRRLAVGGATLLLAATALLVPGLRGRGGVGPALAEPTASTVERPSPTIATPAPAPIVPSAPSTIAAAVPVVPPVSPSTAARACRAAVLVHGGGYFFGDAGSLELPFADPLRRAGYRVWNVDYPMLPDWSDVTYDDRQPWYPRPDVDSTPAALRTVHDRATDAVALMVADAIATGCDVTLFGISAGGSIVADLAHRFPEIDRAVLVVGASLTPDRIGGAPLEIFYGAADEVVLPQASIDTCERWRAAGSACVAHRFEGDGHLSPGPSSAALASLIALS